MNLAGDIGSSHRSRVDALLLPCFIEYRVWKYHGFPEASAPPATVFDAAYFGDTGRKRFVLTDHTFTQYPSTNGRWDGGKHPRSVGLRLCDKNYFNDCGNDQRTVSFTARKGLFDVYATLGRYVLPRSAHDGTETIKSIDWVAKIDPAAHPARPAGAARSGTLPRAAVTFKNHMEFEVALPDGTASSPGPGRLVGPSGHATCPIEVNVEFEAADEGLGLSGQGAQSGENLVCYKDSAPETTVDVMIHEFCHSAGMAAIGSNPPPPGVPQPKTTAQADPDNECSVSTLGHLYSGHGHSGGRCARASVELLEKGEFGGGDDECERVFGVGRHR